MALPTTAGIAAWADQSAAKTGLGNIVSFVAAQLGGSAEVELTISSGSVAAESSGLGTPKVTIDTESDAASDTLANVTVDQFETGQYLMLGLENASRVVTITHEAGGDGQLSFRDGLDLVLSDTTQWVLFYIDKSGTDTLYEIARFGFDNSMVVSDKTGNYTVLDREHGSTFTNDGAAGTVIFTLPTPRAGLSFKFFVQDAQTVQVVPPASETIWNGNSSSTTGLTNGTAGSLLILYGIDGSTYVAVSTGTWSAI